MNSQTQIEILENSLKQTFAENGLTGRFNRRARNKGSFVSLSGILVSIFFRAVLNVEFVSNKMREMSDALSKGGQLLFVSPHISQQLIDSLDVDGVNFFSPEGYSRIRFPGFIYIVHAPTARTVERKGNAGSAFVGKASIIPRLFFKEPERIWQQVELASASGLTRAYVSIVVKRMLDAGYIRQQRKGYCLQAPDQMLDDWSAVYRFDRYIWKQEYAMAFRQVREGMDKLAHVLVGKTSEFAMTGPCGAYLRCPYMEPSVVKAYVSGPLKDLPGLHPVERDGNVVLYVPPNPGVFVGKNNIDRFPVVSDIQLYLDLKKMPGRSGDQADYLRENLLKWSK